MPVTVAITTVPLSSSSGVPEYGYVDAAAEDYASAREAALAQVADDTRAIAIRVDRT